MVVLSHRLPLEVGMPSALRGLHDVQVALALQGQVEDAPGHGVGGGIKLQPGAFLGPVLDVDLLVAVGGVGGDPKAPRRRLAHPPNDLLGQILAVELVHALDDGLHQLAGGGVVGVLGDGDHPDALAPQHGLEGHGVLALSGEARKLPDQDDLERGLRLAALLNHLAELRAVSNASALRLVHVLAGDGVAVGPSVVLESPELGGHGQIHVLPALDTLA